MKNTFKSYILGFLSSTLLIGCVTTFATDTTTLYNVITKGINIVVNGYVINPTDANGNKVEPIIYNGTTYLPVRALANALGQTVYWDDTTQTVYIGQLPASIDASLEKVKAAGEIIIGVDDSFAPMGFKDKTGKLIGFDVDLAEAVAKELGVKAKFKPIDWSAKEMELTTDRIDLIWNGLSITDERKEKMMLTDTYLDNKMVIMTKKGSNIKTITDLIGKNIGVQTASYALDLVMENSNYKYFANNIIEYNDYDSALVDLDKGNIEAIVIDQILGRYKNVNLGDKYDFADEDFGSDEYGVGVKLGSNALFEAISNALNTVKQNGKATEISIKWFGEDIITR